MCLGYCTRELIPFQTPFQFTKVSLIALPEHVLLDILGHLSTHDVLSFRIVR